MARIYLVRHGKASSTWDDSDPDPGLNDAGRAQAEAMAAALAARGPLPIIVSPYLRTRETAAVLERQWNLEAKIEPRIGEIPAPPDIPTHHTEWLKKVLQCRWRELDEPLLRWRDQVLAALWEINGDTVMVSHFVAINATVGYALNDDLVTCFRPENCSCTVLDLEGNRLQLVELGAEGAGRIL